MPDALADGAGQFIIGPVPGPGFPIRGQVLRHNSARQPLFGHDPPCPLASRQGRRAGCLPVMIGVTVKASESALHQILTPSKPLWRRVEVPVGKGASAWPEKRPPSDGDRNPQNREHGQDTHHDQQHLEDSLHLDCDSCSPSAADFAPDGKFLHSVPLPLSRRTTAFFVSVPVEVLRKRRENSCRNLSSQWEPRLPLPQIDPSRSSVSAHGWTAY